jgi:pimeloyl-ACP methyl ester carboxylesterase
MKAATRDGVTLRYLDAGAGDPPLLFVHGWTCNTTSWRAQVSHFATTNRVVALDLRGHGESDKPDQDYTIDGFVDDVAWFARETGLDKPVVIGHSMGGVIALNLAHSHPDVARAVVLVDAPLAFPEALQGTQEQILAGLQSPAYAAIYEQVVRQFFFNADSPPELLEELLLGAGAVPQRLIATALASALEKRYDMAGPIPVPALFIRAATHLASEESLRERFPGMDLVTVQAAHFVQLEKPEETNALIEKFVGGVA